MRSAINLLLCFLQEQKSIKLASETVLHKGPTVSKLSDNGTTPCNDNRPMVVFNPTRSFHALGTLTEPPVSDPIPQEAKLNATEAAAPDDEPPATASKIIYAWWALSYWIKTKARECQL